MKGEERQKNGSCAGTQLPIVYKCLSTKHMIVYKTENVKRFNKKDIKNYEEQQNFKIESCPTCKSKDIIRWGTYTRNIVYLKNNQKVEETIQIKRIKCNKCEKTHAIIPYFLVPYKVHTQEYITEVLKEKLTTDKTYKEVSEKKKISRQLTKYWIRCFEEHYTRIITTTKEKEIKKIFKEISKEIYRFIEKYYKENQKIYMMNLYLGEITPILKWAPT